MTRLAGARRDWNENVRIHSRARQATRRRGGDGLAAAGLTAAEPDTLIRADRENQEARPCRA